MGCCEERHKVVVVESFAAVLVFALEVVQVEPPLSAAVVVSNVVRIHSGELAILEEAARMIRGPGVLVLVMMT